MREPLLPLALFCAMLLAQAAHVEAQTASADASARVIVKYKADSPLLRKDLATPAAQQADRAAALGKRLSIALRAGAGVAERTQVVFGSGITSEELAQRLAAESDIEYAVPDRRRHHTAVPNDPLVPRRSAHCRSVRRARGRPVVSARSVGRSAVVDQCRAGVGPERRRCEHRRRGDRHRRALRPPRSPARGGRRQSAARLRHDQRRADGQRRRRARRRRVRSGRLGDAGRSPAAQRAVLRMRHRGRGQLLARHADQRPDRRADQQRHRHGRRRVATCACCRCACWANAAASIRTSSPACCGRRA